MSRSWRMLNPETAAWPAQIDALWAQFDPADGLVVPAHFVKTTFVTMGGMLAVANSGALGMLFPRAYLNGQPVYTLRLQGPGDPEALAALINPATLLAYDPGGSLSYHPGRREVDGFSLGAPDPAELEAIRGLHSLIWGVGAEGHYPDDLHSAELGPATSMVARRDGQLVGFLLGFHRFALAALAGLQLPYRLELGIESQVMGVAPAARRSGLAAALKREQARQALAEGLEWIHWTADPLQYANAALNFGQLRAVAGEFYPAYYPFQNELNRVTASRLGVVWLLRSACGQVGLEGSPSLAEDERGLSRFAGIAPLNAGPVMLGNPGAAPYLALEVPADWTALQRDDHELALRWRAASDELLARHLGFAPGRYVLADVAAEGPRRYLIAHRFTPELLAPA